MYNQTIYKQSMNDYNQNVQNLNSSLLTTDFRSQSNSYNSLNQSDLHFSQNYIKIDNKNSEIKTLNQLNILSVADEKIFQCSETDYSRISFASSSNQSPSLSSVDRNDEPLRYNNQMDIESEQLSDMEERNVNQVTYCQNSYQNSQLIEGDILININQIESLLSEDQTTCSSVNFTNSQINNWKKCVQIEKDITENGCFYVSVEDKNDSQLVSISEMKQIISKLQEKKISMQNQMHLSKIKRFDYLVSKIDHLLQSLENRKQSYNENKQLVNFKTTQNLISDSYSQSVKKAKNIMRSIVNANGSTNSFVFAQLKAFNSNKLSQEINQLIYSPKLIQILYGTKNANNIFYNQVLRKGIIEMFDPSELLNLNQLEINSSSNESQDLSARKNVLTLYTYDNFQIPITVTFKRFKLLESEEKSKEKSLQDASTDNHDLIVYDIKIKIKYQKQLNKMRKTYGNSLIKKSISKNNSPVSDKSLKKKKNQNNDTKKNNQNLNDIEQADQEELKQDQQEYFGYYLETLGFLNKFYPETLSEGDKFDNTILLQK